MFCANQETSERGPWMQFWLSLTSTLISDLRSHLESSERRDRMVNELGLPSQTAQPVSASLSGLPSQGEGLPGQETLWWTPEPSNSSRHRIASDAYLGPKEVRAEGRVVPVISNVCVDPSCEPGYCPRCSKHPHPSTWCCWLLGNQNKKV